MNLEPKARAAIEGIPFTDPDRAVRLLASLAGQGVTDDAVDAILPDLLERLASSADPDRSLLGFVRWIEAVGNRATHFHFLSLHPEAMTRFFQVCASSQLFADVLIRQPEYIEILMDPGERSASALHREVQLFVGSVQRTELKLEAIRRVKQRELLRIGARDLLGLSDLPSTAKEFSHLADALVEAALKAGRADFEERSGRSPAPIAVIGMGKLGGEELNYASDIDLLFVAKDDDSGRSLQDALALAEFITNALSRNMHNGHVFRIDLRLRPEGRFGPLARTLTSYRHYYETWAEPWERQALLKARPVAGDPGIGAAFCEMAGPIVFRRWVTSDFLEAVRDNKRRIEARAAARGETETNVKVGRGGIRDIEFAAQLLQLKFGGRMPALRTGNTLHALAALCRAGLLSKAQEREISEDYCWLRIVEHRLQILYGHQTQTLPPQGEERRLLARRLGYLGEAEFDQDFLRRRTRVRERFESIFWDEAGLELGAPSEWAERLGDLERDPKSAAVAEALRQDGFLEPERGVRFLETAYIGNAYGAAPPEDRSQFAMLVGRMVDSCARTGDPDLALQGLEAISMAAPNPSAAYRMLADSGELLERLAVLGAYAPEQVALLARRQEWLDLLVSEEILEPEPKPTQRLSDELQERGIAGGSSTTEEGFSQGLASFVQRERLRIAARDLWGEIDTYRVGIELSNLAEAAIEALLDRAVSLGGEPGRMAIVGMGKFGGRELGYTSDWDVQLVYEPSGSSGDAEYHAINRVAERLLSIAQEARTAGAAIEVDPRLRPEGRFGPLASDRGEMARYYRESAQTWEKQALLKARFVAGDRRIGEAYLRDIQDILFGLPLGEVAKAEIGMMKDRIERERLKPGERETNLKLGHGGLSDIEFIAQSKQWQAGLTAPETRAALRALASRGHLSGPDAILCERAYDRLATIRNRLALAGLDGDRLPDDSRSVRRLAFSMGVPDRQGTRAEDCLRDELGSLRKDVRRLLERELRPIRRGLRS